MPDLSIVEPRLDEKPWGGRRLEHYGFDLPPGVPIGEALVTAGDARISDGVGAGGTLGDVVARNPATRLGPLASTAVSGRNIFPLLVKLIDASENLSIQVHPNDEQAQPLDRLGKTEAWHVLAAEPGAKLYIGLSEDISLEEFATAARKLDGSSSQQMRAVDAEPGMTILIPAGTIHALGAGVMVYEIQQPSDVTFRLDDWGRVDAQGRPREMHVDQGFQVGRAEMRPEMIDPVPLQSDIANRELLVACRYFALERIALTSEPPLMLPAAESPQVLTVLSGSVIVRNDDLEAELLPRHSAVIWPATEGSVAVEAKEPFVALRAWVPDLARDVVDAARRSGADDRDIAGIGAPLADVLDLL